jgi:DNA-binding transcriptional ArsR family regulator
MTSPDLTTVLAGLSDPTRQAIVLRLAHGPATATQLAELAPISRPAVSQHLRVLRDAGLVSSAQSGRFAWYELNGSALIETQHWLGALVDRWASAPPRTVARTTAATGEPA